jgi:hypothetical protein
MIASKPIAHVAPLRCGAHQCGREFGHARVAAAIPEAAFVAYIAKLNEAQESRVHQEWQLRMQAELAAQERQLRGELSRAESIAAHRRHVCEQLLCLRCPQCSCVFVDFSDCFALACSRCSTRFCAWCLVNCGDSNAAHRHVASCALNTTQPRGVFGSASQFEMCHRERRTRLVREYLRASVPADLHADVLAALAKDLANLRVRRRAWRARDHRRHHRHRPHRRRRYRQQCQCRSMASSTRPRAIACDS